MRILIVVPSLALAGAETQAVDLANGLASMGHTVYLCMFGWQIDQRARLSDAVHFYQLKRRYKFDLSLVTRLADVIDQEKIDVIQGVLEFAVLIATLAAKRSSCRPPVVAAVHTTVNRDQKHELIERVLYRRILRQLPAVLFVCEHQRDHWVRRYPELKKLARVVHNGVEPQKFRREEFLRVAKELRNKLGIPEEAFVFSCIAAFRPEKGHELLIAAFAELPADTYLLLAGDGARRATIEAAVRSAGLYERVRFLGAVPDVRPVIVGSNATILASTAVETFSMAMLESMALGVTVIAPRIGGLAEAIIDGETGLLFPVGDVEKMAQGMQALVGDRGNARDLGQAAQRMVAQRFTLAAMLEKYEQVLWSVLEPARPVRPHE